MSELVNIRTNDSKNMLSGLNLVRNLNEFHIEIFSAGLEFFFELEQVEYVP